jgi:hypothetical protein
MQVFLNVFNGNLRNVKDLLSKLDPGTLYIAR